MNHKFSDRQIWGNNVDPDHTAPSFQTDMPGQRVQTQIRLLLEEQSDQGLPVCHSICTFLTHYFKVKSPGLNLG